MKKPQPLPQNVANALSIKNIKTGFGHDLQGAYCDIYLNKKKVGYLNDDGWGGEVEIQLSSADRNTIISLLDKENFRQYVADSHNEVLKDYGGSTMEANEVTDHYMLETLVNTLIDLQARAKSLKKLEKDMLKGIVYGIDENHYHVISWKGHTLESILKLNVGKALLERTLADTKAKLKDKELILNTNLQALGLQI